MGKRYFGTDGIRGQVGKGSITVDFMLQMGWAVGRVLAHEKHARVLIGRDTRISGVVLQSALQAGLSAAGVDAHLLGVVPTPAVAYLTHSLRANAGIVITASHNLFQDNGVKFFSSNGMKLSEALEYEIEAVFQKPMQMQSSSHLGRVETLVDAAGRYIEFCKSTFPQQLNLNGFKMVVDCANGAASDIGPAVFHELGAEVVAIHHHPDGVNINLDCGATHLHSLQQAVLEHGADVGIAFDGDADRLMMVDHQGEVVDGDQILCVIAKDSSTGINSRSGVVGTLMTNLGLEQALYDEGIELVRSNVGDRHVLAELLKRGWTLGGESSGHIVNLDYTTTGDGVLTALQVLRIMRMSALSLYDLKQQMVKQPQVMENVPLFGDFNMKDFPEIEEYIVDAEKKLKGRGRVLVRASGTERCLRVMAEGQDLAEIRQVVSAIVGEVNRILLAA